MPLHISSRITGEDLNVLRTALEAVRFVALDFAEVKLVDHDAVRLLARTDVNGKELRHNPVFIMGTGDRSHS